MRKATLLYKLRAIVSLRRAGLLLGLFACAAPALAQFPTNACVNNVGGIGACVILNGMLGGSGGQVAANYNITFSPTQPIYVPTTAVIVAGSSCATDSVGNIVGVADPSQPPIVSPTPGTGTLPAGTYYVAYSVVTQFPAGQTKISSPAVVVLSSTGSVVVSPPAGGIGNPPPGVEPGGSMGVYFSTDNITYYFQAYSGSQTASYTQSVPVQTSGTPPIGNPPLTANTTACIQIANDAGWPIAGYQMTVNDASGNTMPGFPVGVQFFNAGSTYNLSGGLPLWDGVVRFPSPVLLNPAGNHLQGITGPISLTGYNLINVGAVGVGTAVPAWGVDIEGTGLLSFANAKGGYLVNGATPTTGNCLGSDGTAFDVAIPCITTASLFYQTVRLNNTSKTQRAALNFSTRFTATDSSSPAETTIDLNATGSEPEAVTANGSGTSGHCAQWIVTGGIGDSGHVCPVGLSQDEELIITAAGSGTNQICTTAGGDYITGACTMTLVWPVPFVDTNYGIHCQTYSATIGKVVWIFPVMSTKSTTGVQVLLENGTASGGVASTTNEVDCSGRHP